MSLRLGLYCIKMQYGTVLGMPPVRLLLADIGLLRKLSSKTRTSKQSRSLPQHNTDPVSRAALKWPIFIKEEVV